MALVVGTIKSVSGLVTSENEQNESRTLYKDDSVNLKDIISTQGEDSHVVLILADGRELVVGTNETLVLDESVSANESFGRDAIVANDMVQELLITESLKESQYALFQDNATIDSDIASNEHPLLSVNSIDNNHYVAPQNSILENINSQDIIKIEGHEKEFLESLDISQWTLLSDQNGVDTGYIRYESYGENDMKIYLDFKDIFIHTDFS